MPEKIQKGMSYTGISQILSMGLKFATSVVLARGLGDAAFGLFNVFQSGLDTLSLGLDFGGNSTITKFMADNDTDGDRKGTYSVLTSTLIWHGILILIFWVGMAIFSQQIMGLWFDDDKVLFGLFVITVPVAVICGDFIGALYGLRELKYVAIRMVTQQGLVALGSLILVFWLGFGVRIAVLILAAVWIVLGIGLARVIWSYVKNGRLEKNPGLILQPILRYSLPIGGVYVVETIIRYAPILLVKAFTQGSSNVNQVVASLALAVYIAGIAEALVQFLTRSGYGYLGNWHRLKLNHLFLGYVVGIIILTIVLFAIIGGIIIIGLPFFISKVYGNEYLGVQSFILLTLITSFLRSLTYILRVSLYVMDSTLKVFRTSIIELILYIGFVCMSISMGLPSDWGIRLLQIAVLSSSVRVVLLMIYSLRTFTSVEKRPVQGLLQEAMELGVQAVRSRMPGSKL